MEGAEDAESLRMRIDLSTAQRTYAMEGKEALSVVWQGDTPGATWKHRGEEAASGAPSARVRVRVRVRVMGEGDG